MYYAIFSDKDAQLEKMAKKVATKQGWSSMSPIIERGETITTLVFSGENDEAQRNDAIAKLTTIGFRLLDRGRWMND